MRRFGFVLLVVIAVFMLAIPTAWAGSPHFVDDTVKVTVSGNTLTVTGKEAGLGDESQVHIEITANAECVNGGGHNPSAANKSSFNSAGDFPVQNGKANFRLSVTATFQPRCSPPMKVVFTSVTVTDTTNGISASFSSPF
jgi:hypothetical protein